jgi:hypothetical protein
MRKQYLLLFALSCLALTGIAQDKTKKADSTFKPSGKLWGYVFADYFYKDHSDSFNRGGSNQYTNIEKTRNQFQIRRAYLGYDYDMSPKFSAQLLLAAEDNVTTSTGSTSGDLLSNNKLAFYIKNANIRIKNLWNGTDLVLGEVATPAFSQMIEPTWGYRSIERTIADVRRTPSFDLGATLQGKFDPKKGNYGYNVMVGNGTSAKPENDKYKWFYGDLWAKFFNKKLLVDFYADYMRLNWVPTWHHDRAMLKGFIAYTDTKFTVGVEGFINTLSKDNFATKKAGGVDTLTVKAKGVSVFARGTLIKNKLAAFGRFDTYNPDDKIDNNVYSKYVGNTSNYNDPNTKESFFTLGLDYTPAKNIHFMPNVWYNSYKNQSVTGATGALQKDYDIVYRMTFYYVFGK